MNKRNLQAWELRLGVFQLVILLGIVTGSMACAFYIGFSSGRAVGFESALERSLANVARIPIASESLPSRDESSTTDVYAKLSQPPTLDQENQAERSAEGEVPLGSIRSAEVAPVIEEPALQLESKPVISDGPSSPAGESKTLGSLLNERSAATITREVEKAKPVAKELKTDASRGTTAAAITKPTETLKREASTKAALIEKPAATKTQERPTGLIRDKIPAGWFAQVAAPRRAQDANALAGRLKASGFAVMIEVARVRGDEYYRVLVGPEQNRSQAERLVGQLKRESYIQGEPFIRVVK